MKRRLIMFLFTMMMIFGMVQTAFADEVKYYEVTGQMEYGFGDLDSHEDWFYMEVRNGLLEYGSDYRHLTFTTDEGSHSYLVRLVENERNNGQLDWSYVEVDGIAFYRESGTYDPFPTVNGEVEGWKSAGSNENNQNYWMGFSLLTFSATDQVTHSVSTGFTGTAVSDRGDYDLFIAGYFSKELMNGTHELTLNEISSQTIAIVAHNRANGVNRNMNQSTIEEMTVTVSGGQAVSLTIRGRVQTNGGTLDRYTAVITP